MTTSQRQRTATPTREAAQRHTTPSPEPTRSAWRLVATREIVVRLTNRAFVVSTLLTIVLIAGFALWSIMQGNSTTTHRVLVASSQAASVVTAADGLATEVDDKVRVEAVTVSDDAVARQTLADEGADAYLHRSGDQWTLTTIDEPDVQLRQALAGAVSRAALAANAAAAGTTVEDLMRGATLASEVDSEAGSTGFAYGMGFAFALLFFLSAVMFGQMIASSVIEEKQSRLVEIIATAIPLRQLLAGKVIGNSAIALAQLVLFTAVGIVAVSFSEYSHMLGALSGAVGWFIAFFAVGFVALACIFAVGGALASRTEDLQATTAPVTTVLMLVYFASLSLEGTAERIASFVPIASVISMPTRVLRGDALWWEPVVALAITVAFAAATVILGEKVYRRSLMQTRGRLSWRQALATEE
ncbi:MAG TPA: ABC transporter permease [Intrasporangium sp.]|uniref:ABC transporter permease n=1 Tax=Intrasporangium sp. TaxID=1925024 RepID=UPI002B45A5B0|nr:ABC transporter permease [Intrasporangium sp.]HKX66919.1 ABC transporter permease [Intrasporangium sp.]